MIEDGRKVFFVIDEMPDLDDHYYDYGDEENRSPETIPLGSIQRRRPAMSSWTGSYLKGHGCSSTENDPNWIHPLRFFRDDRPIPVDVGKQDSRRTAPDEIQMGSFLVNAKGIRIIVGVCWTESV